jgi:SlyX protein
MSADVDMLKQQMMDLQSQLAFQEDAVRSLDEALAHQQQELLMLRRQLELLQQRQQDTAAHNEASLAGAPADDNPPHY